MPEFRHLGNQCRGDDRADARRSLEPAADGLCLGIGVDQGGHQRLDLGDAPVEKSDQAGDVGTGLLVCSLLEPRGLLLADLDKLTAARRLGLEHATRRRYRLRGCRSQPGTQLGEHARVHAVGLSDYPHGPCEVAGLARVHAAGSSSIAASPPAKRNGPPTTSPWSRLASPCSGSHGFAETAKDRIAATNSTRKGSFKLSSGMSAVYFATNVAFELETSVAS
ncbi:UNVERIFIED_ORG: hypothetical protein M2438_005212 [Methylobacterium sp. SuP10 SLI 274]|nr:hypothetical protein [Methylorubrum extorquens]MDF9789479.1 hypothetical protein [Methylorubrum extorquens]MDF9861023.1 hypothetical protein [Methylorubrum pseudosasae]MDH6639966.1 hypothetical protein [Methylobacterium sp. SuP10 SLI 274]MDH6669275.1 hypothetical protein [Methylorubrum zatmanii]